jgi:hypothetical protein
LGRLRVANTTITVRGQDILTKACFVVNLIYWHNDMSAL